MIAWLAVAHASVADGFEAYERGDLDAAIAAWDAESRSGVLEYDLGTAWLRKREPLSALPHLVAAARLRPRDGDVFHNLSLARLALGAPDGPAPTPPVEVAPALARVVTPGELSGLGLVLAAVASAAAGVRERVGRGPVAGLAAVALAVILTAAWTWVRLEGRPIAVVVAPEVVLRDAPDAAAKGERDLPPGSEVRVLKVFGPFALVEDGRAHQGWVPEDALVRAW